MSPISLDSIDVSKPLFFCDVDGAINHLNQYPTWVGSGSPSQLDYIFMSSDKWKVQRMEVEDPARQFKADEEAEVSFNKAAELPEIKNRYRKISLQWSNELVQRIAALSRQTNFIWLTTWKSEASRLLDPLWNIDSLGYLDWNIRSDLGSVLKWSTLSDFLESMKACHQKLPAWIWVDDDEIVVKAGAELQHNRRYDNISDSFSPLIVRTNKLWGLDRREIFKIEDFVYQQLLMLSR